MKKGTKVNIKSLNKNGVVMSSSNNRVSVMMIDGTAKVFDANDVEMLKSGGQVKAKKKYAKGGNADVENNEMVLNNNKQIKHHTEELPKAIKGKKVPAWVVAKVNRSASDLSDATHYMDGQGESYANGGNVFVDESNNVTYTIGKNNKGIWTIYSESKGEWEKRDEFPKGFDSKSDAIMVAKDIAGLTSEYGNGGGVGNNILVGQVYLNTTTNGYIVIDKVEDSKEAYPSVYYHTYNQPQSYRNSNIDRISFFEDLVDNGVFVLQTKMAKGGGVGKIGYAIMQKGELRTDAYSRVEFFDTIEKALFTMSHVPLFKSLTKEEKLKLIVPYTKDNKMANGGKIGDEKLYYVVGKKKGQLVDVSTDSRGEITPLTKEDAKTFAKSMESNYDYNSLDILPYRGKNKRVKMAKGGQVDLFEDYDNIPENIQAILDRYSEEFGGDGSDMDYQDTANMLKEVEAEGYTFGYGLDNEPYGLRPIGVRLNQLKGFEEFGDDEYAKGGRLTSNEDIIEAFLTSNREAKVGNLSTHYNEYDNEILLRNYGTLIASRKGNNLNITSIKYSVTTTKITNMVNRMAKDKGLNVKYVEKFEDGGMTSSYCYEIGGL